MVDHDRDVLFDDDLDSDRDFLEIGVALGHVTDRALNNLWRLISVFHQSLEYEALYLFQQQLQFGMCPEIIIEKNQVRIGRS